MAKQTSSHNTPNHKQVERKQVEDNGPDHKRSSDPQPETVQGDTQSSTQDNGASHNPDRPTHADPHGEARPNPANSNDERMCEEEAKPDKQRRESAYKGGEGEKLPAEDEDSTNKDSKD